MTAALLAAVLHRGCTATPARTFGTVAAHQALENGGAAVRFAPSSEDGKDDA